MILGFLGAGHLASYTVQGLRASNDSRRIVVSPRNAVVAAQLAEQHGCEVASSNQDLIDACDAVVLSVRPEQCAQLLDGLRFKSGQLVISVMAGVSLSALRQAGDFSAVELVRSLPIQCAAVGVGPVPLFPASERAELLLQALGTVVVLRGEDQFETAATLGCMHGWVYPWLSAMSEWAVQQGLDGDAAVELSMAAVQGAVAYGQSQGTQTLADIGAGIATEGTYTLAGLEVLQQQGGLEAWIKAMNLVADKARAQ